LASSLRPSFTGRKLQSSLLAALPSTLFQQPAKQGSLAALASSLRPSFTGRKLQSSLLAALPSTLFQQPAERASSKFLVSTTVTLNGDTFDLKQRHFALEASRKSRQCLVSAHNPVAWNQNGDGIATTRTPDGSGCPWATDLIGKESITGQVSEGDFEQLAPNLLLKSCATRCEFELKDASITGKVLSQLTGGLLKNRDIGRV
jgi:hypothetical protein